MIWLEHEYEYAASCYIAMNMQFHIHNLGAMCLTVDPAALDHTVV